MNLKKIDVTLINKNAISLFKNELPIIVCGNLNHHNGLTVAWGSLGSLWRKNIATIYIKPTRYTFEFANSCEYFTIMWFDDKIRSGINKVFGSMSGRDVDKEALCELHSYELDGGVAYEEATMIMVCRKLYQNAIKIEKIIDDDIKNLSIYQDQLFHHEYIGEIVSCYIKDE